MGITTADIAGDLAPSGVLRASINLGNPVLAQGTPQEPTGITVDIAREIGTRLGVPVEFLCFDAARKSFEAMTTGEADICFLAIEPARAAEVAFTAAYVVIEGVYVVPRDSAFTTAAEVDREGVRIGVKHGSAYDLFLARTLEHATVVRGADGVDAFRVEGLEAAAGIRQPMAEYVAAHPDVRLIEGRFMQIQQAVGTTVTRKPETVQFLRELVEELKASGFVADALRRANQSDTLVAPPATFQGAQVISTHESYELSDDKDRLEVAKVADWLATDAYWAIGRPRATVQASIAGSDAYGVYAADGEQVAFCRVVTDRATFGWLCDVYVDRAHRGSGIARWMVAAVRDEYAAIGVRRLLLATGDAHGVYAAVGFVPLVKPEMWMELAPTAQPEPPTTRS